MKIRKQSEPVAEAASCTEGDAVGSNRCWLSGKKGTDWQGEMLFAGLRDKRVEQTQITAYSSEREGVEIRGGSLQ